VSAAIRKTPTRIKAVQSEASEYDDHPRANGCALLDRDIAWLALLVKESESCGEK
jgi:hypothetical protein